MESSEETFKDQKTPIQIEESIRHEVIKYLENKNMEKKFSQKIWQFFNTPLGIWFLSTCIVGLVSFGYQWYKTQEQEKNQLEQKKIEQARINASLVVTLLPHLTSSEEKQWRMAIEITKFLKEKGQLPGELESALVGIVRAGDSLKNKGNQSAKIEAAATVIDLKNSNEKKDLSPLKPLPSRVYIQIANTGQTAVAELLQNKLRKQNFITPEIDNVGNNSNYQPLEATEIRYYRDEEKDKAYDLLRILQTVLIKQGDEIKVVKIPGNGGGTRPGHFEIWFAHSK